MVRVAAADFHQSAPPSVPPAQMDMSTRMSWDCSELQIRVDTVDHDDALRVQGGMKGHERVSQPAV